MKISLIYAFQNSFYCRRRLSLIEALNNSIQEDLCCPNFASSALNPLQALPMATCSHSTPAPSARERIFSVRQILSQNQDLLDRGRLSMRRSGARGREESYHPIQQYFSSSASSHQFLRSNPQKRSRRQPNNNTNNTNASQESEEEQDGSSWNSACRSSLHSTSSSSGSRSSAIDSSMQLAEALFDHIALMSDELPFATGDIIYVLDSCSQSALWYGSCNGNEGWFPSSHCKMLTQSPNSQSTQSNREEIFTTEIRKRRANVVEELMRSERDYVRLLEDIVQGFLEQTRRRTDLFTPQRIRNIFGNIQSIYVIHSKLLRDLEMAYDQMQPEMTNVGAAFLRNKHSFNIYTDYCNNRSVSVAELNSLSRQPIYAQFFEACRLLRGLPNLSLEGFLLTPIQRLCRYPLQLSELLKATPSSHEDLMPLEASEKTMRSVATLVNETKRRGPDVVENNSTLLRTGDVYCRVMADGQVQWGKQVLLFLFDQSIVLCKKDVLRDDKFIFKDRLSLDLFSIVDVKDGKESNFNVNVKHSLLLTGQDRLYLISCGNKKSKQCWLTALRSRSAQNPATAEERRLAMATLTSA
ncbi:hypothetical protein WR25_19913 isoform B [Diploscapter pachys]|uniref:DH domain-containing protein n=2 Tax=Diploscapter pachys TaxID=2018661 RepID=A0A2A2LY98_9BILA|nr:hypothetical protein WR25_19913 isoform B [Diploscapter pachys]